MKLTVCGVPIGATIDPSVFVCWNRSASYFQQGTWWEESGAWVVVGIGAVVAVGAGERDSVVGADGGAVVVGEAADLMIDVAVCVFGGDAVDAGVPQQGLPTGAITIVVAVVGTSATLDGPLLPASWSFGWALVVVETKDSGEEPGVVSPGAPSP
jgi:hypothetical protein